MARVFVTMPTLPLLHFHLDHFSLPITGLAPRVFHLPASRSNFAICFPQLVSYPSMLEDMARLPVTLQV